MPKQGVLESANPEEAELAATARKLLVSALDHSNTDVIKLILDSPQESAGVVDPPVLALPPRALRALAEILRQMAQQQPMLLVPQKHELSTQEAASFLNVSRPFVVKEIEAGRLKCRKVNRHRRIEFEELRRYQAEQQTRAEAALQTLTELSEDAGLEF